jgi:hypothetical protein
LLILIGSRRRGVIDPIGTLWDGGVCCPKLSQDKSEVGRAVANSTHYQVRMPGSSLRHAHAEISTPANHETIQSTGI